MKCLSNRQKAVLAQIARRAHARAGNGQPLAEWRREQVFAACGRYGLTAAEGRHYNDIAARFESLLGNDGRALVHLVNGSSERRRQQEFLLLRLLASAKLSQTYVEKISQARFKCAVTDTTDAQLHDLVITIKARVRAKAT